MGQAREIKEGDSILVATESGWTTAKVDVVYRDRHGVYAVVCGGKRYDVSSFKRK